MTANQNGHSQPKAPAARPQGSWQLRAINGALGMGAEILFACGLMLVGFLISLLCGW